MVYRETRVVKHPDLLLCRVGGPLTTLRACPERTVMTTIAIIGAGPGLGHATAARFGRDGFKIALIARNAAKLRGLADRLAADGYDVGIYPADAHDEAGVRAALAAASSDLGPVEVLQYSPVPKAEFLRSPDNTSLDDLWDALEFSVMGSATAIDAVLPGMSELGRGTILLVNGSSAVSPNPAVTGTSVAFAAESAYGALLHRSLADRNIHVGQLIVPGAIREGDPSYGPDVLADLLWNMHIGRGDFRVTAGMAAH